MIEFKQDDILKSDAEALVNTVNCVGVMGRGVALQFKNAYPLNFKAYKVACDQGEVRPGKMFIFETGTLTNPKYIVNFPTKRHWKDKSRIEDIENGLSALVDEIENRRISSIAIPPLGSGLGGLPWNTVRSLIQAKLSELTDVRVIVYEPTEIKVQTNSILTPPMTSGKAAMILLIRRYLSGLMDPFITLLEVHKLMYFMQETGEPLKLSYAKGYYGPYAKNLSHVLRAVEGHYISGYGDGGDDPTKPLKLIPGSVKSAEDFLSKDSVTRQNLNRVSELVTGFETPDSLELLATVHWLVSHGGVSEDQLVEKVYAWGARKRRFSERQIALAYQALRREKWVS